MNGMGGNLQCDLWLLIQYDEFPRIPQGPLNHLMHLVTLLEQWSL